MLSKIDFLHQLTSMHWMKSSFGGACSVFRAGFVLGALEQSFSGALQEGFLKRLGDTVLLDWVCLSLFCFFMSLQTDWWWSDQISVFSKQKSHWIITINGKMNVWKCKLIFPTDTLQQKIEITDLKPFLAAKNTSVLIILATTVVQKGVFYNQ